MSVIYLTNDLLFSSRVAAAARAAGTPLAVVPTLADASRQLEEGGVQLVLADLEHPEADARQLVGMLQECRPRPRLVVYGPHVRMELLAAAEAAGCDLVLSRGQFNQQINDLLAT